MNHAAKIAGDNGAGVAFTVFVIGTVVGLPFAWIGHRKRKALRRFPWTAWPIRYLSSDSYEWVELLGPHGAPDYGLLLSTWPTERGKLVNHDTSEIWFAGDPTKYGVISRPGGGDLRYAYRSASRPAPQVTDQSGKANSRLDQDGSSTPAYQLTREGGVFMRPVDDEPKSHGARDDPRYPSPRRLRRACALLLDWILHLGCGLGAAIAVSPELSPDAIARHDWQHLGVNPLAIAGFWAAASVVDRVVIQSVFHTTVGKAIFGLTIIRPDDGTHPSFGRLLKVWVVDLFLFISALGDGPGPDRLEDYCMPAVRRRDVRKPVAPHNSGAEL